MTLTSQTLPNGAELPQFSILISRLWLSTFITSRDACAILAPTRFETTLWFRRVTPVVPPKLIRAATAAAELTTCTNAVPFRCVVLQSGCDADFASPIDLFPPHNYKLSQSCTCTSRESNCATDLALTKIILDYTSDTCCRRYFYTIYNVMHSCRAYSCWSV